MGVIAASHRGFATPPARIFTNKNAFDKTLLVTKNIEYFIFHPSARLAKRRRA